MQQGRAAPRNWTASFFTVACCATLLLLTVGGMVTGYEEGLSVVDWPNSMGHNMFLYPLSMMTGGIYYEHAHRLMGSLVGLTTLVLAFHLLRAERRRWLKTFAFIAVAAVIVQGILGGLRVTGHFTLSTSREEVAPSIALAIAHGVLGQLFFASLVAMRGFVSDTWKSDAPATPKLTAASDRSWGAVLVALLVVQLVLGAVLRHVAGGLLLHITVAVLVAVLAAACGARAWGLNGEIRVLRRLGQAILVLITVQVTLGLAALVVTGFTAREGAPSTADVIVTGAHQIVGALLLAGAVLLTVFSYRLLAPLEQPDLAPSAER
jgi:cytochrome c oxidase assembly protein subunit 15